MAQAFIALGSNLGKRQNNIKKALRLFETHKIRIIKSSSLIETEPVGGPPQNHFYNAVIEIQTEHSPQELLSVCQSIEEQMGRKYSIRNGPRIIDLDILLYEHLTLRTLKLTIPHPRMLQREFVMKPLREIAPSLTKELSCAHH